jgi:hypothetical protein
MKNLYLSIADFFVRLWKVLFSKHYPSYLKEPEKGLVRLTESGALTELAPDQVYNPAYIHPIYFPPRNKFKPCQREFHLGRRRSRFYFNKNK